VTTNRVHFYGDASLPGARHAGHFVYAPERNGVQDAPESVHRTVALQTAETIPLDRQILKILAGLDGSTALLLSELTRHPETQVFQALTSLKKSGAVERYMVYDARAKKQRPHWRLRHPSNAEAQVAG